MLSRRLTPLRAVAVLLGLLTGVVGLPAVAVAAPSVPTQLGAADLTLINGVRLAGLWEMPAGQMAAARGNRERVREIGAIIAQQHVKLDQDVVDAANKLGVPLPNEPTPEQQGWLKEMRGASSNQEFDQIFVSRLRAAHGKIFPIVGAVRSSTRNDIVRALAENATNVVMGHMTMLESTGMVRYGELAPAAIPEEDLAASGSLRQAARSQAIGGGGFSPTVVWVVLIASVASGIALTYRVFRPR